MADDVLRLFTRAQVREMGLTDTQIDDRLASGVLVAHRRGILHWATGFEPPLAVPATAGQNNCSPKVTATQLIVPPTAPKTIPLEIQAGLLASPGRELVASHATAARLLGLPKPLAGWPNPEFTAQRGPGRRRSGVQITVAHLDGAQVVERLGIALTSPARTIADCLRTLPGRDALAIFDAALHNGMVRADAVVDVLSSQTKWPGVAQARQVLPLANGRRESPLESWSAWAFAHTDVPAPEWQVEIREQDGHLIGRLDCWWTAGVAGEADGRAKYVLAAAEQGGDAQAIYQVLHTERQRERNLRDAGADVVRWSAADVLQAAATERLAQRIFGAISLAQANARFTGLVAPTMHPLAAN